MPDDAALKAKAWPIEKVVACAKCPCRRSANHSHRKRLVLTRVEPYPCVSSAKCRQSCRFGRSAADRPNTKAHRAASKWCPRLESNQRHQV